MNYLKKGTGFPVFTALALCLGGAANAAEVFVTSNISTSTTWTASNTYNLQGQIYVLPGASLTIEPGTVVASTTNGGGSLAVCRGAQIFVNGTQTKPVIMTSKADVATWTGGNPKTGVWREAANEWGNLTIMGNAHISENAIVTNTPAPSPSNVANMEGLVAGPSTDQYGGGDDDDDSGVIHYLSLRYGGKVVGLNNELNGLSLGGIGRGTDIHHVDIMNNIDDGIEIWGGTVNLKYVNIWNIGDDSFDLDQGWRGKAQFGLIVCGYSVDQPAGQGSGVGDHAFEMDGAEQSDYQPVTTANLYNFTVISQPGNTRSTTAFRDGARVQFHNCIFMDGGGEVVKNDNVDGDGGLGYGFNGTLAWAQTWTTPYTSYSTVNAPANPQDFYLAQSSGNLTEITDSVFYNNTAAIAYTEATARGVFNAANNNVKEPAGMPIVSITRGATVVKGGKSLKPVIGLNPTPANDALVSVGAAPADGFFTPAQYRGAFAPSYNWLAEWTASSAFGYTSQTSPGLAHVGVGTPGCNGQETIGADSAPKIGNNSFMITYANAPHYSLGLGLISDSLDLAGSDPFGIGVKLHADLIFGGFVMPFDLYSDGHFNGGTVPPLAIPNDPGLIGATFYAQGLWVWTSCMPSFPYGLSTSDALAITIQP